MKIIFIRHAEPDYEHNTLTPNGFKEAEALGKCYSAKDFDYVYSSPLPRAKLTCDAVIKGEKEVIVKEWLKEFFHAIKIDGKEECNWDLLPRFVEKNSTELFDFDNYLEGPIMESGEMKKYADEVIDNFDKLLSEHGYKKEGLNFKAEKPNNDTIVIFAHLGLNSLLIGHLAHIPYWQVAQYFCLLTSSVTTFVSEEREDGIAQFRCIGMSNVDHLYKNGLKPSFHARYRETRYSNDRK